MNDKYFASSKILSNFLIAADKWLEITFGIASNYTNLELLWEVKFSLL